LAQFRISRRNNDKRLRLEKYEGVRLNTCKLISKYY